MIAVCNEILWSGVLQGELRPSKYTKTGVPIAAGTLVLSGLFKWSEPQKEVTPESLTAPCGSMSFPMYGWMVSNNLPFHPMAQCSMGTITIYEFTSSK